MTTRNHTTGDPFVSKAINEAAAPAHAAPEPAPSKKTLPASMQYCAGTATRKSAKSFVMRDFSGSARTVASRRSAVLTARNRKPFAMAKVLPSRSPTPHLSEIELCAWVAAAETGDVLEYHRGFLAHDRTAVGRFRDMPARAALGLLADRAHDLAAHGLIHLVQRRHAPDDYSYLAIARPRSRTAPVSLSELMMAEVA